MEMTADTARTIRDMLLKQTDHLVLPDSGKDSPEIRKYRQDLRDVPQQLNFPKTITWPVMPE